VVKAELPDIEWLVRAFDTYIEASQYLKLIRDINNEIFDGDNANFGKSNSLDPDMVPDDGEPDYYMLEVLYGS
jgi:hypothetical protein